LSIPKAIAIGSVSLFIVIGALAIFKKESKEAPTLALEPAIETYEEVAQPEKEERIEKYLQPVQDEVAEEEADQIWRLFTTGKQKLPIVETIRYKSRVSWLKGRPAWITDYASHYSTSRHFIARSLNGKKDYYTQKVTSGDSFNILKKDLSFYLVVDLSRCKMWFYAHDLTNNESLLLKTYKVGLGRFDSESYSGLLTPRGKFTLGDKVAIYKPGINGYFQESEVELVQVFGTRWIPFLEELSAEGDNPRGYGFHGAPWVYDEESQTYHEDLSTIGKYESDGCIRLPQNDIEELFSIVITKPTIVEIVTDFHNATIPGDLIKE